MHLAKVVGTIWATQKDENLCGLKMQIIQPVDQYQKNLGGPVVAIDTVSAGPGELIYYVTAREATIPCPEELTPVDAAIVGIVDRLDLYSEAEVN